MKRSAEEILSSINPVKSAKRYDCTWKTFVEFIEHENKPTEENLLQFFEHLKIVKKYASSTIWSVYSMLNNKYQALYGEKLQKYPRITMLIKSYEAGYVRKTAEAFSKDEMMKYLNEAPNSGEHIHIKCAATLGFFGGLRCADLITIECHDFNFNETTGMWVKYSVSKQRGEKISNTFNVPLEFCKYLELYDNKIADCNANEGRLLKTFRACKSKEDGYYTKQPMGIHTVRKFPVKMASFLGLSNPKKYTGHSFRRSAANVLSEAGASTSNLKTHFNWKSENTSLKYLDNTQSSKLAISKLMFPSSSIEVPNGLEKRSPKPEKMLNVTNCQNIIINF